jgi:2-polyprenyl-3-methyl-5-hydroxy-6-metoxy-1,4-benzoquinol methylase
MPIERCPNCQIIPDIWLSRRGSVRDYPSVGIVECSNCSLVTHAQDLRNRVNYQSGSMHSWAQGYGQTLPQVGSDVSRRLDAIKEISIHSKVKTILDFGSGSGEMLRAFALNFQVAGLEPDDTARELSTKSGSLVYSSTSDLLDIGLKFDLVTLFHVVEHFYEPVFELNNIKSLLEPDGLILIETPNANDVLLTKYQNEAFQNFTYWSHHPMLHSHKSIEKLLIDNGFEVLANEGTQRYGLANHFYWLSHGMPGGHETWRDFISKDTDSKYQRDLVSNQSCDTLWVLARKT